MGFFPVPDFISLSETILVVNRGFLILLRSEDRNSFTLFKYEYCLGEFQSVDGANAF